MTSTLRVLLGPVTFACLVILKDFRGDFACEVRIGELGADFGEFVLDLREFLADALTFGGDINQAFEGQEQFAEWCEHCARSFRW